MEIDNIYRMLIQKIEIENIRLNEDMNRYTSFKIGGKADILVLAKSIQDIENVLKIVKENDIPLTILGNGTNVLIKDNGIRGIVLKIDLQGINIEKNEQDFENEAIIDMVAENDEKYTLENSVIVEVAAGEKNAKLAKVLLDNEIQGFEFAAGIPGTLGGAVRMNAGAYGGEMKDIVVETTYIDENGEIKTIDNESQKFSYRHSVFCENKNIIVSTKLRLSYGNKELIKAKMQEYLNIRKEKQPLDMPSAGSTFKRGQDFITAKVIDECGLKGYSIGDAEVSNKHAGFIVNKGKATAADVLKLIEYVQETVMKKQNKKIELEIEVLGE